MDRLELGHLAHYLPYNLQIKILNHKCDYVGVEFSQVNGFYFIGDNLHVTYICGSTGKDVNAFKPILRPMSDIGKVITVGSEQIRCSTAFDLERDSDGEWHDRYYANQCESPFVDVTVTAMNMWLFEYHFDVFGLIEKGLAIDINTLNQ